MKKIQRLLIVLATALMTLPCLAVEEMDFKAFKKMVREEKGLKIAMFGLWDCKHCKKLRGQYEEIEKDPKMKFAKFYYIDLVLYPKMQQMARAVPLTMVSYNGTPLGSFHGTLASVEKFKKSLIELKKDILDKLK